MYGSLIQAVLQIFGLFFIGYFLSYRKYIKEEDLDAFSKMILDVFMPLYIFAHILRHFDPSMLTVAWPLPLIGFYLMGAGAVLGLVFLPVVRKETGIVKRTFLHICTVNNFGFLPYFIIMRILGDEGISLLFLLNLGSNFAFWSIGLGMLLASKDLLSFAKKIFSPALVSLSVSFLVVVLGLNKWVPSLVLDICYEAGKGAIPFMLIIIGASFYPFKYFAVKKLHFFLIFLRLVLIPVLTMIPLFLFKLDPSVFEVALIVSIMPAATSSAVLTRRYGGDFKLTAEIIMITTFISLFSIPLSIYCWKNFG